MITEEIFEKAEKCWPDEKKLEIGMFSHDKSVLVHVDGGIHFDSLQDLEAQLDKKLEAMKPKEEWALLGDGKILVLREVHFSKEKINKVSQQGNVFPSKELAERERDRRAFIAWKNQQQSKNTNQK